MFKKLVYFVLVLFFGLTGYLLTSTSALAADEFYSSTISEYRIKADGTTAVSQKVSLTNRLANVYASKYSFTIGSTRIKNIAAYDADSTLPTNIQYLPNKTEIEVEFTEVVTGKGETVEFTLFFETLDFSFKSGQVWEITLPKLANAQEFQNYQINLIVPKSFGDPALISPEPDRIEGDNQTVAYFFTGDTVRTQGIMATFGDWQIFEFNFTYQLENNRPFPVKTQVALPPDTDYQRVYYDSIEPPPKNVTVDSDGNWLAEYELAIGEKIKIQAQGSAQIFLQPNRVSTPPTSTQLAQYLEPQKYWQVDHPDIQNRASKLKTVKAIYDYVATELLYDYGRIELQAERLGALQALKQPQSAICMEFTDLFVALARAAGIPARAVNGYAYTSNSQLKPLSLEQDLLHSWPEYWDEENQIWRPVDPTWENTTGGIDFFNHFDLNHFVFAIYGSSSTLPLPVGAYKLNGSEEKDVVVEFGKEIKSRSETEVIIKQAAHGLPWLPINASLVIQNLGNHAIYQLKTKPIQGEIQVNSTYLQLPALPPFASYEIPFLIKNQLTWSPVDIEIAWQIQDQIYRKLIAPPPLLNPELLIYLPLVLFPIIFNLLVFTISQKLAKKLVKRFRSDEKIS